jgi:hypothetical protein
MCCHFHWVVKVLCLPSMGAAEVWTLSSNSALSFDELLNCLLRSCCLACLGQEGSVEGMMMCSAQGRNYARALQKAAQATCLQVPLQDLPHACQIDTPQAFFLT